MWLSTMFNPLTPESDQDIISPGNINTKSTKWVMRIKKNINLETTSWSNTKFSDLAWEELYDWQLGELQINFYLRVKGLRVT